MLTELEGAILAEIERLAPCTAYGVRRGFQTSRSTAWSGSTGAVYPAIRKLKAAGLVSASPTGDRRGGETLGLTPAGRAAVEAWLSDTDRAVELGLDPFRTRMGFWSAGRAGWPAMAARLETALQARLTELENLGGKIDDTADQGWLSLEIALQRLRLDWLRSRTGQA